MMAAWWRLLMVGLLLAGLFPIGLSPLLGVEESVVTAVGCFSLWCAYLAWYAVRHVMVDGHEKEEKKLPVTIVTGFLVRFPSTLDVMWIL